MESNSMTPNVYYQHTLQTQPVQQTYRTEYLGYTEPMFSEPICLEVKSNEVTMKTINQTNSDANANSNTKSVKHYDGGVVANQFISYFYQTWVTNPTILLTDDVIKPYSKLKYSNQVYEGESFVEVLKGFISTGLQFTDCNLEILDSGSRQIYILVTGTIKNELTSKNFSQTFMIAYAGENNKKSLRKWTLMNSLFIVN